MKNLHYYLTQSIPAALLLVAANTLFAQLPTPPTDISGLRWVTIIGGEAAMNRKAADHERLMCALRKGKDVYDYSREDLVLLFSCGLRAGGDGFGSWVIRRVPRYGSRYHFIAAGTFTHASISNLRSPTLPGNPRLFVLRGRTTFLDNDCVEDTSPKNIKIIGSHGERPGGVAVEITDERGRVVVRGIFRQNVHITTAVTFGGDALVNQRFHLD